MIKRKTNTHVKRNTQREREIERDWENSKKKKTRDTHPAMKT